MVRPNKNTPEVRKNTPNKSDWQGFVDIPLTLDQKQAMMDSWPNTATEFADTLYELLLAGYKVSFNMFGKEQTHVCAITGKSPENPNVGFTVSSFGGDPSKALWAGYYKVAVIAGWGRWKELQLMLPENEGWG